MNLLILVNVLQMYQRREKNEKVISGSSEGILDLFRLLESTDPEEVESVKNVIHENLSTGIHLCDLSTERYFCYYFIHKESNRLKFSNIVVIKFLLKIIFSKMSSFPLHTLTQNYE